MPLNTTRNNVGTLYRNDCIKMMANKPDSGTISSSFTHIPSPEVEPTKVLLSFFLQMQYLQSLVSLHTALKSWQDFEQPDPWSPTTCKHFKFEKMSCFPRNNSNDSSSIALPASQRTDRPTYRPVTPFPSAIVTSERKADRTRKTFIITGRTKLRTTHRSATNHRQYIQLRFCCSAY